MNASPARRRLLAAVRLDVYDAPPVQRRHLKEMLARPGLLQTIW